jgi:RNA polymerase sigma-70 factor (ECF subfamily)
VSLSERLLLRRLRDRDEKAFRQLVDEQGERVTNLLYRMLGNRAEAEDLAQEVFISVFKSIDTFRGESKLSTWLFRVAINHSKNRVKYLARRHDRQTGPLDEDAERARESQGGQAIGGARIVAPDRALETVELERALVRAIGELEEDHRAVILLRDVEELSYDEICQITGLPEGTVKSRLHRARLALKEKLGDHI